MCGAVALFACLDAMAKYLNTHMDRSQVAWARYTSAFVLALIVSNPLTHAGPVAHHAADAAARPLGRCCLLSTAAQLLGVALSAARRGAGDPVSTPFLVAILAGPLLGEWVGWRRWTAIVVGFVGVLLVTRPGLRRHALGGAALAGGAICYASTHHHPHRCRATDSNETTLFYANLSARVVMLPVLPFVWTPPANWVDLR